MLDSTPDSTSSEPGSARPALSVRKVDLDFADTEIHWNPSQPEYSQLLNAISSMLPYLEPFLIRTVRGVREVLPPTGHEELRRDIALFIAQEGRHYKLHARFNKRLRGAGYAEIASDEEKIRADFDRISARGLRFALAYGEGFETFGPLVSSFFFDTGADLMGDVHEPTVYLWLWHFAEEYEHRAVCNELFEEAYGSYWHRVYGLWFATVHLFGHSVRVAVKLIRTDHRSGRIPDRWRSWARFGRVVVRLFASILPKMIGRCMRPSYDPRTIPAPRGVLEFLDEASQRYGVADVG